VFFPITFAWVAINAPFVLGYQWQRARPEPAPAVAASPGDSETSTATSSVSPAPFFFSLIPAERRGEVISLKAELHYLTVTTTKGRSMILYALGDAIEELPAHAGIQTHRSYWASLPHAVQLARTGRNAKLKLSDGSVVPVSRNRVADVKRAMKID
jgi:DNA-binding LytR/AlgR family response regulator